MGTSRLRIVRRVLVECKPSTADLNIDHATQLHRSVHATDARLAVLTNGLNYQFYSDVKKPNRMHDRPFFTFSMDSTKPTDIKTPEKFAKGAFDPFLPRQSQYAF